MASQDILLHNAKTILMAHGHQAAKEFLLRQGYPAGWCETRLRNMARDVEQTSRTSTTTRLQQAMRGNQR